MSNKIDLSKIIDENKLDKKEIAKQLFPSNQFPMMALTRIVKGEAFLNSEQLSKLSLILDVEVSALYSGADWALSSSEDTISFKKGTFTSLLCTKTFTTRLYDGETLFHEQILHKTSISLSEYTEDLNAIIKNK